MHRAGVMRWTVPRFNARVAGRAVALLKFASPGTRQAVPT
jgi:hypothetical protein